MAHKTRKSQVRIDPTLYRAGKALADLRGVSGYEIVEEALRVYLARHWPEVLEPSYAASKSAQDDTGRNSNDTVRKGTT